MLLGLDHAIIALRSLDTVSGIGDRLGLVVAPGGAHPGKGTHNAIVRFGLDYLEIIALSSDGLARRDREGQALLAHLADFGEGWLGFALASDDIARDVELARARGLSIEDPTDGARARPDGRAIRWRTARVVGSPWGGTMPFLIQHASSEVERRSNAPAGGHPLGATRVAGITIATPDVGTLGAHYAKLLGAASPAVRGLPGEMSGAACVAGKLRIELVQPDDGATGDLAEFVRRTNGGVYSVALAVRDLGAAIRYLRERGTDVVDSREEGLASFVDPTRSAGARISLVEER
jgi:hypothetical protein